MKSKSLAVIIVLILMVNAVLWLAVGSMAIQGFPLDSAGGEKVYHLALTFAFVLASFVVGFFLDQKDVDISHRECYNRFSDHNSGSH